MKTYAVDISPAVYDDLQEIQAYISETLFMRCYIIGYL